MAKPVNRPKRPFVASLDQVRLIRQPDGESVTIEYADDNVGRTTLRIGPEITELTDEEVLDRHNKVLRVQAEISAEYDHVAVEIPMGRPQMEYSERANQWVPRGGVLRVLIDDDMDSDGDPAFIVDDTELTVREFARMLHTWNGWGIRITLVPDNELHAPPAIEVHDPDEMDG